ncbi:hypothetical protein CKO_05072 [Citrobacter koseri ATCC BAA-895]|uniref:Uncharacterized protein n=1 Tax=Citrobacter koseri (strain ATCC BAA-895 / CDC 4225-83 / SGSC4696) TaxID=290338 RepID=A8ARK2_CITK8|nr:hypothetical protein CKO_05072 [Citrobacter koseri ATCC BAA-895]
MWGIGQDGNGEGGRHRQHLIFIVRTITKIVDYDGEFASKNRGGECQQAGE